MSSKENSNDTIPNKTVEKVCSEVTDLDLLSKNLKSQSIRHHIYHFATTTSAHGFMRIAKTNSIVGSVIWAVFMIAALGGLSYHFFTILICYLDYTVQTQIINDVVPFVMPSVTICPTTPYIDRFMSPQIVMLNLTFASIFPLFNNFWKTVNTSNAVKIRSRMSYAPYSYQYSQFVDANDFGIFCIYNDNRTCTFTNFMMEDLSTCFRIDLPNDNDTVTIEDQMIWVGYFTSAGLDPSNLFYKNEELFNLKNPTFSFHSSTEYPDFQVNKVYGYDKHITIAQVDIRLQNLWFHGNSCIPNPNVIGIYNFQNQIQNFSYTQSLCNMVEQQKYVFNKCKCYSELLPIPSTVGNVYIQNLPFCHKMSKQFIQFLQTNPTNTSIFNNAETSTLIQNDICHKQIMDSWTNSTNCNIPCNVQSYTASNVVYNSWPTPIYLTYNSGPLFNLLSQRIASKAVQYNTSAANIKWSKMTSFNILQQNLLGSFMIRPQRPAGLQIIEQEAYPLWNLLSSFGAILGLWLGISVISIIELIELIITIFNIGIVKNMCRK